MKYAVHELHEVCVRKLNVRNSNTSAPEEEAASKGVPRKDDHKDLCNCGGGEGEENKEESD